MIPLVKIERIIDHGIQNTKIASIQRPTPLIVPDMNSFLFSGQGDVFLELVALRHYKEAVTMTPSSRRERAFTEYTGHSSLCVRNCDD